MNTLKVHRHRDALREGITFVSDGDLQFGAYPKWSHIGDEAVFVVGPLDALTEFRELVSGFTPEGSADPLTLYTSDSRVLLHSLKYLLTLTGVEEFSLRQVEEDESAARAAFDLLYDKWGHVIAAQWLALV